MPDAAVYAAQLCVILNKPAVNAKVGYKVFVVYGSENDGLFNYIGFFIGKGVEPF